MTDQDKIAADLRADADAREARIATEEASIAAERAEADAVAGLAVAKPAPPPAAPPPVVVAPPVVAPPVVVDPPAPATPPAPPAPAPASTIPPDQPLSIDLGPYTRVCGEGESFTVVKDSPFIYAAVVAAPFVRATAGPIDIGVYGLRLSLTASDTPYVASNALGGDPCFEEPKSIYVLDATAVGVPSAPAPGPVATPPAPPAPPSPPAAPPSAPVPVSPPVSAPAGTPLLTAFQIFIKAADGTLTGSPITDADGHVWGFGSATGQWADDWHFTRDGVQVPDSLYPDYTGDGGVIVYHPDDSYGHAAGIYTCNPGHNTVWRYWVDTTESDYALGDPKFPLPLKVAPAPAVVPGGTIDFIADDWDISPSKLKIGSKGLNWLSGQGSTLTGGPGYFHTTAKPDGFKIIKLPAARKRVALTIPDSTWQEVPNTDLVSQISPELGNGGTGSIFNNWTGGAPIPAIRMTLIPPGGWHLGNDNSVICYYDWDTFERGELYPPSPLVGAIPNDGDRYPNPAFFPANHYYGGASAVLDPRDNQWKLALIGTSGLLYLVDPIAKTVEHLLDYQNVVGEIGTNVMTMFNTKRQVLFMRTTGSAGRTSHMEFQRNKWFLHSQANDYSGASVIEDPARDRFVMLGGPNGNQVKILDMAALEADNGHESDWQPVIDKTATGIGASALTLALDTMAGDYVLYGPSSDGKAGRLYAMDPVTFTVTDLPGGIGGDAPRSEGTWGRFWFDDQRDLFFVANNVGGNIWAYRRARSAAAPAPAPAPSAPAPAPGPAAPAPAPAGGVTTPATGQFVTIQQGTTDQIVEKDGTVWTFSTIPGGWGTEKIILRNGVPSGLNTYPLEADEADFLVQDSQDNIYAWEKDHGSLWERWDDSTKAFVFYPGDDPRVDAPMSRNLATGYEDAVVQRVIDGAAEGSTVEVDPGQNPGAVSITKSLVMQVAGYVPDLPLTKLAQFMGDIYSGFDHGRIYVDLSGHDVTKGPMKVRLLGIGASGYNGNIYDLRGGIYIALAPDSQLVFESADGYYTDHVDGFLGSEYMRDGVTINMLRCNFERNGRTDLTHSVYNGPSKFFRFIGGRVTMNMGPGHQLKSRAANNIVEHSDLIEFPGDTASAALDSCLGGRVRMKGCLVVKGPDSDNSQAFYVGREMPWRSDPTINAYFDGDDAIVEDNLFIDLGPAIGPTDHAFLDWALMRTLNSLRGNPLDPYGNPIALDNPVFNITMGMLQEKNNVFVGDKLMIYKSLYPNSTFLPGDAVAMTEQYTNKRGLLSYRLKAGVLPGGDRVFGTDALPDGMTLDDPLFSAVAVPAVGVIPIDPSFTPAGSTPVTLPPAPAPAPGSPPAAPGPAAPAPISLDVSDWTKVGAENSTVTLVKDSNVAYGANGLFFVLPFKAGDVVSISNATFGDPTPNVVKAGYVQDASVIAPPSSGTPAAPSPAPSAPAPASPAPAPVASTPAAALNWPMPRAPSPAVDSGSLGGGIIFNGPDPTPPNPGVRLALPVPEAQRPDWIRGQPFLTGIPIGNTPLLSVASIVANGFATWNIYAWTSLALHLPTLRLIGALQGGHTNGWENGGYGLRLWDNNPVPYNMVMADDPSTVTFSAAQNTGTPAAPGPQTAWSPVTGHPWGCHQYGNVNVIFFQGKWRWVQTGMPAAYSDPFFSAPDCPSFIIPDDGQIATWDPRGTVATLPAPNWSGPTSRTAVFPMADGRHNLYIQIGQTQLRGIYNSATNSYTQLSANGPEMDYGDPVVDGWNRRAYHPNGPSDSGHQGIGYFPEGGMDQFIKVVWRGVNFVFDPHNVPWGAGEFTAIWAPHPYDMTEDALLLTCSSANGTFWRVKLSTGEVWQVDPAGLRPGVPDSGNLSGRAFLVPDFWCIAFWCRGDVPPVAYKLPLIWTPNPAEANSPTHGAASALGGAQSPWRARPRTVTLGTYQLPEPGDDPLFAGGPFSSTIFIGKPTDPTTTIFGGRPDGTMYLSDPQSMATSVAIANFPPDAIGASGDDGHAGAVIGSKLYSFYRLRKDQASGRMTAETVAIYDLDGTLIGNGPRAAGWASEAGLVTANELNDGLSMFSHTLVGSLPSQGMGVGFVSPAVTADANQTANAGQVKEGTLMMLPASFPVDQLSTDGAKKTARTLMAGSGFGVLIGDMNSLTPIMIYVEGSGAIDASAADLWAITRALRPVTSATDWIDSDGVSFTPPW